ncbi:MAG: hypothetical protein ABSH04_08250, partial [Acidimicrobiales bacterium]
CQSNLISIDGTPVSVSVVGPTNTALDNGEVSIVPCGSDTAGITLGPGDHVVETALGHTPLTGWNVDQLTLDSAPGGGPAPAAPFDSLPATQPGPTPTVTVTRQTPTSEQLEVTGATAPFELVLGQSENSGWKVVATPASPAGIRSGADAASIDLGSPQLVDGFANGWQVTAVDLRALGASGRQGFTVSLEWTPQQQVWVALVVSAIAIVLCIALALLPERLLLRRARRRASGGSGDPEHDPGVSPPVAAQGHRSETARVPERDPVLWSPLTPLTTADGRVRTWVIAVVSVLTGLVAGAITSPFVGAAAAVATAGALTVRWLRGILTLTTVGLLLAAAASVVVGQALHAVPESSNWPPAYDSAGLLVWMAVVALGADAVASTTRRLHSRLSDEELSRPLDPDST